MTGLVYSLARGGDISWLSYYFAEFVSRQAGSAIDDLPGLVAAVRGALD